MPEADVRRGIDSGRLKRGMHIRDAEGGQWMPIEQSPFGGLFSTADPQTHTTTNTSTWLIVLTLAASGFLLYTCNSYNESRRQQKAEAEAAAASRRAARELELQRVEREEVEEVRSAGTIPQVAGGARGVDTRQAFIQDLQRKRPEVGVSATGANLDVYVPTDSDACGLVAASMSDGIKDTLRRLGFVEVRCSDISWRL